MGESSKPKHIIEGFVDDFNQIKQEYALCSDDLRLDDFFTYWRNCHMDCLFANRFDPRELLESLVEINKKLVSTVTDDLTPLDSRVTALYLLLCISAKQPCRLRQKIRMTCQDAVKVHQLCNEVQTAKNHEDAKFCWLYLRREDAIDFVEDKLVYGPSMLKNRSHVREEEDVEVIQVDPIAQAQNNTADFLESRLEPTMKDLNQLTEQYKQIRDILKLDDAQDATVELQTEKSLTDLMDQANSLLLDLKSSHTQ